MRALCRRADGIREERELLPPLEAAAPLRAHRAPPLRVGHQQEPPVAGRVRQLRETAERAAPAPALGGRKRHGRSIHPRCGRRKFSAPHFLSPEAAGEGVAAGEVVLEDEPPEEGVDVVEDGLAEDPLSPPSLVAEESFFFDP